MSVQFIYDQYLRKLSSNERLQLIKLLAESLQKGENTASGVSTEDKLRLAQILKADAAKEHWKELDKILPDTNEVTLEEILDEVSEVRRDAQNS
jgi:pheromone shutdown protein TraB